MLFSVEAVILIAHKSCSEKVVFFSDDAGGAETSFERSDPCTCRFLMVSPAKFCLTELKAITPQSK